jgi:hypothetical protein
MKAFGCVFDKYFSGEESPVFEERHSHIVGENDTCVVEETFLGKRNTHTHVSAKRHFWRKNNTCVGEETLLREKRHMCRLRRDTIGSVMKKLLFISSLIHRLFSNLAALSINHYTGHSRLCLDEL